MGGFHSTIIRSASAAVLSPFESVSIQKAFLKQRIHIKIGDKIWNWELCDIRPRTDAKGFDYTFFQGSKHFVLATREF